MDPRSLLLQGPWHKTFFFLRNPDVRVITNVCFLLWTFKGKMKAHVGRARFQRKTISRRRVCHRQWKLRSQMHRIVMYLSISKMRCSERRFHRVGKMMKPGWTHWVRAERVLNLFFNCRTSQSLQCAPVNWESLNLRDQAESASKKQPLQL